MSPWFCLSQIDDIIWISGMFFNGRKIEKLYLKQPITITSSNYLKYLTYSSYDGEYYAYSRTPFTYTIISTSNSYITSLTYLTYSTTT